MHARRRLAIVIAGLVGAAVVCCVILIALFSEPKAPVDGSQVVLAIQRFSAAHKPLPETVTFSQLIAEGYLGPNFLQEFGATEVTVYLKADETHPQMFLMDALMADGSHETLLSDGSVQGLSPSRFREAELNGRSPTNAEAGRPGQPPPAVR